MLYLNLQNMSIINNIKTRIFLKLLFTNKKVNYMEFLFEIKLTSVYSAKCPKKTSE